MSATRKSVIVTGAASGIGAACAKLLLAEGHDVCGVDLSAVPASDFDPAARAERFIEARADVSDPAQCAAAVDACVKRFGKLDALIHMAAAHSTKTWREIDAARMNRILSINVTGTFNMAQACALAMEKTGGGAMVLATSGSINVSGLGGNGRGDAAYVASKAGIIGLTRALSRCFAPSKIRVNAVSPGSTRTAMTADYSEDAVRAVGQRNLIGRIAEPEEIASVCLFLISDASAYVWGDIVNVNGGGVFGN